MQNGKWVPVSKYFADSLPRNRKFTELEAVYSLQLDYDNDNTITVSGYASRWGWSRSKVSKFLSDNDVVVVYKSDTKNIKKQRGFIDVHQDKKKTLNEQQNDNKETSKERKRFIDSKWIQDKKINKRAIKKQQKNINDSTTIDPNPEPNNKNTYSNEFEDCWKIVPKRNGVREGKKKSSEYFEKLSIDDKRKCYRGLRNYAYVCNKTDKIPKDFERFIKHRIFDDYQKKINSEEITADQNTEPTIRNTFKD